MKEYISPINLIQKEINYTVEDDVYLAVLKCDITVDKEELIKALNYDRNQYDRGYQDGYKDGYEKALLKLKHINFDKILEELTEEEE